MIPKIIHYCWFGRNPLPKLAKKCIRSWKKFCPDYEIREWNEDNFNISSAPLYVRQAYEAKKWAFVTDYVRLYAIFNIGGVYMDTDVEVIQPIDAFLNNRAFSGFESEKYVQTGIMASEKGHELIKELLDEYDSAHFINDNGELNLETNVVRITKRMVGYNLVLNNNEQTVKDMTFYPSEYFCPIDLSTRKLKLTSNTYTIHHFSGSWISAEDHKKIRAAQRRRRWEEIRYSPNRALLKLLGEEKYGALKKLFGR